MDSAGSRILVLAYQVIMALLYIPLRVISLVWHFQSWGTGLPSDLLERFGYYSREDQGKLSLGYNVWLHAASAGEVNAMAPFCQAFRKIKPEARIILTTTSKTGKKIAQEKGLAEAVFLSPLDMPGPLRRAFENIRPLLILVGETEFWPNWLMRAGRNGVSTLLINGRISDRSYPNYLRFRSLFGPALRCFTLCLVQTDKDRDRLISLGVRSTQVQVVGQMKYDVPAPAEGAVEAFKKEMGYASGDLLFTLGSLREGEDDILLACVPEILGLSREVHLLMAPRHVKNASHYQEILKDLHVKSTLRSQMVKGLKPERVVVLDTIGELSLAYALSRAAFVGGTLVPVGGHNLMEPALLGVPVLFGPFTQNVSEAAEMLLKSGGGLLVAEGSQLPGAFGKFFDEGMALETGRKAQEAVGSMRGATDRTLQEVLNHWMIELPIEGPNE